MMDFSHFLGLARIKQQKEHFANKLTERCQPGRHGDLHRWLESLKKLPNIKSNNTKLDADTVTFGHTPLQPSHHAKPYDAAKIDHTLRALSPWRKGPYQIFDSFIDAEWRSDWKWQRVQPHIAPLTGKHVLDVGCGNGYHCWRMLGDGAESVIGIDPSMLFFVQNLAIQHFAQDLRFNFLPLGIEDMPRDWPVFDTVFSMGVLYHRRNPINHLRELYGLLKNDGEVVLETLIVDAAENGVLQPKGRYAKMRNVWSILTTEKLIGLLERAGFSNARIVNQNTTSTEEQRRTDWMQFHSLAQFLDAKDTTKTIEGYPAPKRGVIIAQK